MDGLSFWTELEMRPPEFGKILLKVYDHFCDSRAPKTEMPNKQSLAFWGGGGLIKLLINLRNHTDSVEQKVQQNILKKNKKILSILLNYTVYGCL